MATLEFRVKDGAGGVSVRQMEAPGVAEAVARLRAEGLEPVSYREAPVERARRRRLSPDQRIVFYRGLAAALAEGAPLVQAISLIARESRSPGLQVVLADLARQVSEGTSLDRAMATWPQAFTKAEAAVVRSAREGGSLPEALTLLADHREVTMALTHRLASALVYPAVVGSAIILLLLFFGGGAMPKFMTMYEELGISRNMLPATTLTVAWLGAHRLMLALWLTAPALCVAVLFRLLARSASGRLRWDEVRLRVPLVGPLLYDAALSRATSLLGVLLSRNVSLVESLRLAGEGAGNAVLATAFGHVAEQVVMGKRLSAAMQDVELFPEGLSWRAAVAEGTGDLGNAFRSASAEYVQQTRRRVQALSAIIEPLLIVLLGVIVAFVIVGTLSPLILVISQLSS